MPTFDEAVALIRGKAGIFPELKTPEIYAGRDVKFEELVAAALDKNGLRGPKADPKTPVILQTFGQPSARKLAEIKIGVPVVLLLGNDAGLHDRRAHQGLEGHRAGLRSGQGDRLEEPRLREVGARRRHDGDAVYLPLVRQPAGSRM